MDTAKLKAFVGKQWDDAVIPTLIEYIKIPNKSPAFDPDWEKNGHMAKAVKLFEDWARERLPALPGSTLEVVQLEGRTPVILIDVPGTAKGASKETVLLYGHLDKQPEMAGWDEGLGPWTPVLKGDKLYGRGGADDGYAMFGSLTALMALEEQKIPHARCVILIEACEETGSPDLPYYVDHLSKKLGDPSLVVCLDSGCGNYDQLWLTTSLRGIAMGELNIRVLEEGVHSGDASGVVPSSFRILRELLSRIEDEENGKIRLPELYAQIPEHRIAQAKQAAKILGDDIHDKFPFAGKTKPLDDDLAELVLNRTWRPALAVTGMDGYPSPQNAGNVLLPFSTAKLSFRLPPTVNADDATKVLKKALEADPPQKASVEFKAEHGQDGWNAPELSEWLVKSISTASEEAFGRPVAFMGEGGSIPFMKMLGDKFPKTQFVVTGVLGPHSNAHGPNEFLHIPTGKKVTHAIARIVADHAENAGKS
ncbi:MAG TPA: M20 family metallopeptidase [Rhizomicrobium sp.]|nr:M20 family metallopeptidase [Rhizomicrobium sp.]